MILKRLFLGLTLVMCLSACNVFKTAQKNKDKNEREEFMFTSLFHDATQQKALGNYDEAIETFKKCLIINPKSAVVNYEIGFILFHQRKLLEAADYAKKAYDLSPDNYWFGKQYAEITKQAVLIDEHIKHLENFSKQFPEKVNIKIDLAIANAMAGKPDEAIKVFNEVENKIGVSEEVSVEKHKLYLDLKKYDDAEKELLKLVESQPNNINYLRKLSEFYAKSGSFELVKKYNDKIIELNPSDPYTHLGLYEYYVQNRDLDKAFDHLNISFANPDLSIDIKVKMLVSFFGASGKESALYEKVYKLLEIMTLTHPNEAKTYAVYADFYNRDEDFKNAQIMFKKALALEKSKYVIWRQMVIVSSEIEDYETMLKYASEAVELFPTQSEMYWFAGISAMQLKKYEEAIKHLKNGKRYVVDSQEMKGRFAASLGDCYHQVKDHSASDKAYEEALKYLPNDVYILNNYAYYLSLRKKELALAASMSKKTLDAEPNNINFLDTYGWILFLQGKHDQSIVYLEKALNNNADKNGTVLEHLGDVYYHLNEMDKALEFWNKAKATNDHSDLLDEKIKQKKYLENID